MVTVNPAVGGCCIKPTAASIRKAKIEKLRMNNSATSIQATWRGNAHRRDIRKVGSTITLDPTTECEDTAIDRKVMSNKDEDDDGLLETKDDVDDEESLAVSAAERLEERQIQDAVNIIRPPWPQALSDDFDCPDWPDLGPMNSLSIGIGAFFFVV